MVIPVFINKTIVRYEHNAMCHFLSTSRFPVAFYYSSSSNHLPIDCPPRDSSRTLNKEEEEEEEEEGSLEPTRPAWVSYGICLDGYRYSIPPYKSRAITFSINQLRREFDLALINLFIMKCVAAAVASAGFFLLFFILYSLQFCIHFHSLFARFRTVPQQSSTRPWFNSTSFPSFPPSSSSLHPLKRTGREKKCIKCKHQTLDGNIVWCENIPRLEHVFRVRCIRKG